MLTNKFELDSIIQLMILNIPVFATDIYCGLDFVIILDSFNNVYVCGRNQYGQLGMDNYINIQQFTLNESINYEQIRCGLNSISYINNGRYIVQVIIHSVK